MTGRSGRGTARQTVRIDEPDWELFGVRTTEADTDRSAAIRAFVDWYNGKPGAQLPVRPGEPADT